MHGYGAQRAFDGRRALPGRALVLVEGGTIGATTLLPGLIDTHVHLCADGGPRALDQLAELDADAIDAIVATSLRQHLAAGVTAVRDLGDSNWAVVDRHRGPGAGPTVVAAGPPITAVQGALLVAGWPGRRYRTAARGGPRPRRHRARAPAGRRRAVCRRRGGRHRALLLPHRPRLRHAPGPGHPAGRGGHRRLPHAGPGAGSAADSADARDDGRTGMTWERRLAQVTDLWTAGIRLVSGTDAGLLVVHGDPLADVSALRDVHTVVSLGRLVRAGGPVADDPR